MQFPLVPLHMVPLAELAAMDAGLVAFAWAMADMLYPAARGRAGFALAMFIAACTLIVAVETALGSAGLLNADNVLAAVCIAAALAVAARGKRARACMQAEGEAKGAPSFTIISGVFAAAAFGMIFLYFIEAAVTPPPATDAFVYHLYYPAMWMKRGAIDMLSRAGGEQASLYYPLNGSLLMLWNMIPLREDTTCNLVQLISLCATCVAVFAVSREMGAGRQLSITAASLPALTPLFILRSTNSDIDILFCAFYVAGIFFLLAHRSRGGAGTLALCGAAFGLCAGTKTISLLYIPPILPFIIFEIFRGPRTARDIAARAAAFAVPAIALCAYWYGRDIALTGNPVYPLEIKLLGHVLLPGAFGRDAMLGSVYHTNSAADLRDTLVHWVFGGGLAAYAAVCAAAGGALLVFTRNRAPRLRPIHWLVLLLPLYILFIYWFVNPNNTATNCRFIMPGVALFYVFAAASASRFSNTRARAAFLVFAAVCAGASALAPDIVEIPLTTIRTLAGNASGLHRMVRVPAMLWAVSVFAALAAAWFHIYRRRAAFVLLSAASALCALLAVNSTYNASSRYKYYWNAGMDLGKIWLTVEKVTAAAGGAKIAVSGTDAVYPLMGFGMRNDIVNIGQDGSIDRPFHIYARRARELPGYTRPKDVLEVYKYYHAGADKNAWLKAVRAERPDILIVFKTGNVYPAEAAWADTSAGEFVLKWSSEQVRMYAVKNKNHL